MLGLLFLELFFFNLYTAFVFICSFVTEANCELLIVIVFFLDFITLPGILSTGLLSRSGQKRQLRSACIESNVS